MKITIRGEKGTITEAMTQYAEEKLGKLDKYLENSENVSATIVVKVRDHNDKVEITIPLKSYILRAEETQEDFYAAIDVATDVLERQIRKNKTRLKNHSKKATKEFIFDDAVVEEEPEVIVKRKIVEVKPMDEEEAILQMELLGHQFYLYKDAESNKPMVVYKRKDGNYGVLEAE